MTNLAIGALCVSKLVRIHLFQANLKYEICQNAAIGKPQTNLQCVQFLSKSILIILTLINARNLTWHAEKKLAIKAVMHVAQ